MIESSIGSQGDQALDPAGLGRRSLPASIFIHINKTAGTSIERALDLPFEHQTALEKIARIGRDAWDSCFTFTVIRNPWDKVVSHYHHRLKRDISNIRSEGICFKEWVHRTYGARDPKYYNIPKMFMPHCAWIADHEGTILVRQICRFENLETDFEHVCKRLNIKTSLPRLKASGRGPYRDYYDAATAGIVAAWFERDIATFGYRF